LTIRQRTRLLDQWPPVTRDEGIAKLPVRTPRIFPVPTRRRSKIWSAADRRPLRE
jgi:hypothetical protein